MSKQSELYALRNSFSGDSLVTAHNRNGDSEGDGAERWNFIASTQSAEADIIDEEERAEQREAKRKFAKLLGLYFKKILEPVEFEYLKEYLKGELTPHKVGLKLGLKLQQTIDYKPIIKSILSKHKANEQKFLMLMQYSGLKLRKNLSFLPQLEQAYQDYLYRKEYFKATNNEQKRQARKEYRLLNIDRERERKRIYRATHREQIHKRYKKRLEENPELKQKYREAVRLWEQTHKEQKKDRMRKYRARNAEKLNAQHREQHRKWRKNATPEQLEAKRERDRINERKRRANFTPEQLEAERERDRIYREQNREKIRERAREYQRQYRAKPENRQKKSEYAKQWYEQNKEKILARKREKRATETITQKELRNKQRRLRASEKRETKLQITNKLKFIEKITSLKGLLRSMSYDFICKIWSNCTETINGETPATQQSEFYFKAFYNSVYAMVCKLVQEINVIATNNASEEDEKQKLKEIEIIGA